MIYKVRCLAGIVLQIEARQRLAQDIFSSCLLLLANHAIEKEGCWSGSLFNCGA